MTGRLGVYLVLGIVLAAISENLEKSLANLKAVVEGG
jgi:hypothetical protein